MNQIIGPRRRLAPVVECEMRFAVRVDRPRDVAVMISWTRVGKCLCGVPHSHPHEQESKSDSRWAWPNGHYYPVGDAHFVHPSAVVSRLPELDRFKRSSSKKEVRSLG